MMLFNSVQAIMGGNN